MEIPVSSKRENGDFFLFFSSLIPQNCPVGADQLPRKPEEHMKKLLIISLSLILALSALAAQGGAEKGGKDEIRIALIVSSTTDDKGWCQAMHDGIRDAMAEMPGKIAAYQPVENTQPADTMTAIRTYVNLGYNIIIVHGSQFRAQVEEASAEFPEVMFAFGTSSDIIADNVFTYMPQSEETGYLSGIVAGLTTAVNKVALVGPIDGGDAARYNRGFVLGVQASNPECRILVTHIGNFNDTVKSGEAAQAFIQGGADVLTGSSQQALGALRAVADYPDRNIWWVGQDTAQIDLAEGYKCIAASAYNYKAVVKGLVEKFEEGVLGGECLPMNFNNGGFIWKWNEAKCSDKITDRIREAVENQISAFKAQPDTLSSWAQVDYSKL